MQNFFFVRVAGENVRVDVPDIIYIEACKNYSAIVLPKKKMTILLSLHKVMALLPNPDLFCQIHRSFIVSLDKIDAYSHTAVKVRQAGQIFEIPIGDLYRDRLDKKVLHINRQTAYSDQARRKIIDQAIEELDPENQENKPVWGKSRPDKEYDRN